MKRFIISASLVTAAIYASADSQYMKFNLSDQSAFTIAAEGMTITLDSGEFVITNSANESMRIPAASLLSMEFSDSPSGVVANILESAEPVEVFTPAGLGLGSFVSSHAAAEALPSGIYLLNYKSGKTVKINLRK